MVGLGLSVITFGIYGFCWYSFVNDELKTQTARWETAGVKQRPLLASITDPLAHAPGASKLDRQ
jgi:hypothetical protein